MSAPGTETEGPSGSSPTRRETGPGAPAPVAPADGPAPSAAAGAAPAGREADLLRAIRIGVRTLHLVAFGGLFGEAVHAGAPDPGGPWVAATVVSGVLLAALELGGGWIWLVQVRGLLTYLKAALLAVALLRPGAATACLVAAIVVGGVSSHMPGRLRYHSVLHGGVRGPRDRG